MLVVREGREGLVHAAMKGFIDVVSLEGFSSDSKRRQPIEGLFVPSSLCSGALDCQPSHPAGFPGRARAFL